MNAPSLTAPDAQKLSRILGMLGSSHQGERDAAGLAASKFMKDRKLAWPDVITSTEQPPRAAKPKPAHKPPPPPPRPRWKLVLEAVLQRESKLTVWEKDFCRSLLTRKSDPTLAQARILAALSIKTGVAA